MYIRLFDTLQSEVMASPSMSGCCTLASWGEQVRSTRPASELSDCFFLKESISRLPHPQMEIKPQLSLSRLSMLDKKTQCSLPWLVRVHSDFQKQFQVLRQKHKLTTGASNSPQRCAARKNETVGPNRNVFRSVPSSTANRSPRGGGDNWSA